MKSKKVKIALVGLGGHGKTIRNAIKLCPQITVIACYDINEKIVQEVSEEFNCKGFSNYDELLTYPDIDAVVIITPNFLHFEQAKKALLKGKDVFVEKPITVSVTEAEEILRISREKGLIVQVGHNTRKRKVFRRAKEIIEKNLAGKIVFFEANISMSTGLGEFPEWKRDKGKCPLLPMTQLGIHFVDTLSYLFGDIAEISCLARNAYLNVEDSTVSILKFSNGIIGTLSSSYVVPDTYEITIHGTEAVVKCYLNKIQIQKSNNNHLIYVFDETIESFVEELCEFAYCVIERKKPEVDAEVGLKNLKVIEAMIQSYINKKTIIL